MKNARLALVGPLLLCTPLVASAQSASDFTYGAFIGGYSITGYRGSGGAVTIPATFNGQPIVAIGNGAFQQKASLTSVSIPINVRSIGGGAFFLCTSLVAITVDAGNASYSALDGVLFNKNLTTLVLFPGGKAGSYLIPDSVTSIRSYAFAYCIGLTNVTIADSVTDIGPDAFYFSTSLTSVTIPASVVSIGDSAFNTCTSLTSITVNPANPAYSSLDGVLFNKNQTTLIAFPGGKTGSYSIPGAVTRIGYEAFSSCLGLINVTILGSVTNIGPDVFNYCPSLKGVVFKGNAPWFVGVSVFDNTSATVYYLPGTTGWDATFAGRPTRLWNPLIQTSGSTFGVGSAGFGFNITGTADIPIVVEASSNLANASWVPLQSLNLTNSAFYFSDPEWTDYPARFYRIRSP